MAVYAQNQEELKQYIEKKESEIIVDGKLAKQLKKCETLKTATPAKIAILTSSVCRVKGYTAIIMMPGCTTPEPPYPIFDSKFIVAPIIVTEARKISSKLGIGINSAITMLILASSLEVATVVSLFKDYETKWKTGMSLKRLNVKFKRKKGKL